MAQELRSMMCNHLNLFNSRLYSYDNWS